MKALSNDGVRLAMERAARRFGGNDGVFNGAGFGLELMALAGLKGVVDGHLVRAILLGRRDVKPLKGSHYQLRGGAA